MLAFQRVRFIYCLQLINADCVLAPEVKVGAFYDPALCPDFGGAFFDLTYNKLVQLDVRDENNDLIPAWKFYEALRPGTLVLANVSLHCFVMKEKGTHRKVCITAC